MARSSKRVIESSDDEDKLPPKKKQKAVKGPPPASNGVADAGGKKVKNANRQKDKVVTMSAVQHEGGMANGGLKAVKQQPQPSQHHQEQKDKKKDKKRDKKKHKKKHKLKQEKGSKDQSQQAPSKAAPPKQAATPPSKPAAECFEVIAKSLVTWEPAEVQHMITDWKPHDFAVVFGDWPAPKLAALLSHYSAAFISTACESWTEEQLKDVIPRLRTKVARKVLRSLFFKSSDPYLSIIDTKNILMAMPECKRRKLVCKLKREDVQRVLEADSEDEDSLDERDDFGSDHDEYESDSFVVNDDDDDDEDDDEGEEGEGKEKGGNELEDSDVSI